MGVPLRHILILVWIIAVWTYLFEWIHITSSKWFSFGPGYRILSRDISTHREHGFTLLAIFLDRVVCLLIKNNDSDKSDGEIGSRVDITWYINYILDNIFECSSLLWRFHVVFQQADLLFFMFGIDVILIILQPLTQHILMKCKTTRGLYTTLVIVTVFILIAYISLISRMEWTVYI